MPTENIRNEKCMCKSGKKYKHCCLDKIPGIQEAYREATTLDREELVKKWKAWNWTHHPIRRFFRWVMAKINYIITEIKELN